MHLCLPSLLSSPSICVSSCYCTASCAVPPSPQTGAIYQLWCNPPTAITADRTSNFQTTVDSPASKRLAYAAVITGVIITFTMWAVRAHRDQQPGLTWRNANRHIKQGGLVGCALFATALGDVVKRWTAAVVSRWRVLSGDLPWKRRKLKTCVEVCLTELVLQLTMSMQLFVCFSAVAVFDIQSYHLG